MDSLIVDALIKRAHEVATRLQKKEREIEAELAQVQKRQAELQATLARVRGANERARNFVPMLGANYQCPDCLVEHEEGASLGTVTNVPTEPGEDVLVCNSRGCQIFFPDGTLS